MTQKRTWKRAKKFHTFHIQCLTKMMLTFSLHHKFLTRTEMKNSNKKPPECWEQQDKEKNFTYRQKRIQRSVYVGSRVLVACVRFAALSPGI